MKRVIDWFVDVAVIALCAMLAITAIMLSLKFAIFMARIIF